MQLDIDYYNDDLSDNDQIIMAQEPEEPVDECDVQQDW